MIACKRFAAMQFQQWHLFWCALALLLLCTTTTGTFDADAAHSPLLLGWTANVSPAPLAAGAKLDLKVALAPGPSLLESTCNITVMFQVHSDFDLESVALSSPVLHEAQFHREQSVFTLQLSNFSLGYTMESLVATCRFSLTKTVEPMTELKVTLVSAVFQTDLDQQPRNITVARSVPINVNRSSQRFQLFTGNTSSTSSTPTFPGSVGQAWSDPASMNETIDTRDDVWSALVFDTVRIPAHSELAPVHLLASLAFDASLNQNDDIEVYIQGLAPISVTPALENLTLADLKLQYNLTSTRLTWHIPAWNNDSGLEQAVQSPDVIDILEEIRASPYATEIMPVGFVFLRANNSSLTSTRRLASTDSLTLAISLSFLPALQPEYLDPAPTLHLGYTDVPHLETWLLAVSSNPFTSDTAGRITIDERLTFHCASTFPAGTSNVSFSLRFSGAYVATPVEALSILHSNALVQNLSVLIVSQPSSAHPVSVSSVDLVVSKNSTVEYLVRLDEPVILEAFNESAITNHTLVLEVGVTVAANVSALSDLAATCGLLWDNNDGQLQHAKSTVSLTLVRAVLDPPVTALENTLFAQSGDVVMFSFSQQHSTNSTAPAFDVIITHHYSASLSLDVASLVCSPACVNASSDLGSLTNDSATSSAILVHLIEPGLAVFTVAVIPLNTSVSIVGKLVVEQSAQPGEALVVSMTSQYSTNNGEEHPGLVLMSPPTRYTVTVAAPVLQSPTVVSSSLEDTGNGPNFQLSPGETALLSVTATLPSSTISNLTFELRVPGPVRIMSFNVSYMGSALNISLDSLETVTVSSISEPATTTAMLHFTTPVAVLPSDDSSTASQDLTFLIEIVYLANATAPYAFQYATESIVASLHYGLRVVETALSVTLVEPRLVFSNPSAPLSPDALDTDVYTVLLRHASQSVGLYSMRLLYNISSFLLPADTTFAACMYDSSAGLLIGQVTEGSCETYNGQVIELAISDRFIEAFIRHLPNNYVFHMTYNATIVQRVAARDSVTSQYQITFASTPESHPPLPRLYSDTGDDVVVIADPRVTITAVSSSDHYTSTPGLTVGEYGTYHVSVVLPESRTDTTVVIKLPSDTELLNASLTWIGGNLNGSLVQVGPLYPPLEMTDFVSVTTENNRHVIKVTFGTLLNVADNVQDGNDELQFEIALQMKDTLANVGLSPSRSTSLDVDVHFENATRIHSGSHQIVVLEPALRVNAASNVTLFQPDARDPVLFTVLLAHASASTAVAYQTTTYLTVPSALVLNTSTIQATMRGPPSQTTAVMVNVTSPASFSVSCDELVLGATLEVTFIAVLIDQVRPQQLISLSAGSEWASQPEAVLSNVRTHHQHDPVYFWTTSTAQLVIKVPAITMILSNTSLPETRGTLLNIAETATYEVIVAFPETVMETSILVKLPSGTAFLNASILHVGSQLLTDERLLTLDAENGSVAFHFGSIVNHPDNIQNSNDQIVVQVAYQVEDVGSNVRDSVLLTRAQVNADASQSSVQVTTTVSEPVLAVKSIQFSPSATSYDAGDQIIFALQAGHTNLSTATAFDVTLQVSCDAVLNITNASAMSPTPSSAVSMNATGVAWNFYSWNVSTESMKFSVTATILNAVKPATSGVNCDVTVSYDSYPGSLNGKRGRPGYSSLLSADVPIDSPTQTMDVASTSLPETITPSVAVQETVALRATSNLPECRTRVMMSLFFPTAQAAILANTTTIGASITCTGPIATKVQALNTTVSVMSIDFGTCLNKYDNIRNSSDHLVVAFTILVRDDPAVTYGTSLKLWSSINYDDGRSGQLTTVSTPTLVFTVVEPAMTMFVTPPAQQAYSLNQTVSYVVTLANGAGQDVGPAYNNTVQLLLSKPLQSVRIAVFSDNVWIPITTAQISTNSSGNTTVILTPLAPIAAGNLVQYSVVATLTAPAAQEGDLFSLWSTALCFSASSGAGNVGRKYVTNAQASARYVALLTVDHSVTSELGLNKTSTVTPAQLVTVGDSTTLTLSIQLLGSGDLDIRVPSPKATYISGSLCTLTSARVISVGAAVASGSQGSLLDTSPTVHENGDVRFLFNGISASYGAPVMDNVVVVTVVYRWSNATALTNGLPSTIVANVSFAGYTKYLRSTFQATLPSLSYSVTSTPSALLLVSGGTISYKINVSASASRLSPAYNVSITLSPTISLGTFVVLSSMVSAGLNVAPSTPSSMPYSYGFNSSSATITVVAMNPLPPGFQWAFQLNATVTDSVTPRSTYYQRAGLSSYATAPQHGRIFSDTTQQLLKWQSQDLSMSFRFITSTRGETTAFLPSLSNVAVGERLTFEIHSTMITGTTTGVTIRLDSVNNTVIRASNASITSGGGTLVPAVPTIVTNNHIDNGNVVFVQLAAVQFPKGHAGNTTLVVRFDIVVVSDAPSQNLNRSIVLAASLLYGGGNRLTQTLSFTLGSARVTADASVPSQPADAGDTVQLMCQLRNEPSSTLSVYGVQLAAKLHSFLLLQTISMSVSDGGAPANATSISPAALSSWSWPKLPPSSTVRVFFDAQLSSLTEPGVNLSLLCNFTYFSTNISSSLLSSTTTSAALFTSKLPQINLAVVENSVSALRATPNDVLVGETVSLRLAITIPEGVMTNARFTVDVPKRDSHIHAAAYITSVQLLSSGSNLLINNNSVQINATSPTTLPVNNSPSRRDTLSQLTFADHHAITHLDITLGNVTCTFDNAENSADVLVVEVSVTIPGNSSISDGSSIAVLATSVSPFVQSNLTLAIASPRLTTQVSVQPNASDLHLVSFVLSVTHLSISTTSAMDTTVDFELTGPNTTEFSVLRVVENLNQGLIVLGGMGAVTVTVALNSSVQVGETICAAFTVHYSMPHADNTTAWRTYTSVSTVSSSSPQHACYTYTGPDTSTSSALPLTIGQLVGVIVGGLSVLLLIYFIVTATRRGRAREKTRVAEHEKAQKQRTIQHKLELAMADGIYQAATLRQEDRSASYGDATDPTGDIDHDYEDILARIRQGRRSHEYLDPQEGGHRSREAEYEDVQANVRKEQEEEEHQRLREGDYEAGYCRAMGRSHPSIDEEESGDPTYHLAGQNGQPGRHERLQLDDPVYSLADLSGKGPIYDVADSSTDDPTYSTVHVASAPAQLRPASPKLILARIPQTTALDGDPVYDVAATSTDDDPTYDLARHSHKTGDTETPGAQPASPPRKGNARTLILATDPIYDQASQSTRDPTYDFATNTDTGNNHTNHESIADENDGVGHRLASDNDQEPPTEAIYDIASGVHDRNTENAVVSEPVYEVAASSRRNTATRRHSKAKLASIANNTVV